MQAVHAAEERALLQNQRNTIKLKKTSQQMVDSKFAGTDGTKDLYVLLALA